MSTIIPQSALVKKAAQYVQDEQGSAKPLSALLEDACMRFNLSPKDAQMLTEFFSDAATSQPKAPRD